jgi:hypothetical protein
VKLSDQYAYAMRDGDHARCIRIEEQAGLYGLPPELVTLGLIEIEAGRDPMIAVRAITQGADQ